MTLSLEALDARIAARAGTDPTQSYTAQLLAGGTGKCARKLGEEAVETVVAAISEGRSELAAESADLIYHLLVLLRAREVPLAEVMAELERRTSQSGLDEKAARHPA